VPVYRLGKLHEGVRSVTASAAFQRTVTGMGTGDLQICEWFCNDRLKNAYSSWLAATAGGTLHIPTPSYFLCTAVQSLGGKHIFDAAIF
jgi:hypothetical protein